MTTAVKSITAWALVPVGLGMAYLLHPLATGKESMTVWTEVTLSNKNAMYFMFPMAVAAVGMIYYNRQKTLRGKVLVGALTAGAVIGATWFRSTLGLAGVL